MEGKKVCEICDMLGEKMVLKGWKEKIHPDLSHLCPRVERTEFQKGKHHVRLGPANGWEKRTNYRPARPVEANSSFFLC